VARLPQPVACLRIRRPDEALAALLGGQRLHGLRLLGDAGLAAVELEEQGGRRTEALSFE
jgi:hypothetical protein